MATFAPETPVQQEYPTLWSRPTQEPKPDISGEIRGKAFGEAFKDTGEVISSGAQGLTAAYEKGIQNSIYAGVDPLRDEYMNRLHTADSILQNRETPDPLGRDSPRDVKQLPGTLDTLDSARANGKLSQTDYDARLNALAKEIRGKYPGFRQYVDEEFKRVTGRDSANQYIRSVIQDIDSFQAAKQAKRDKFEGELMSQGMKYEGGAAILQAYQKDPDKMRGPAMQWLNTRLAADHGLEMLKTKIQTITEGDALAQKDAVRDFHETAGKTALDSWSASRQWFSIAAGHESGDEKQQQMLRALEKHDVDELSKYPKEQLNQLATNLQAWGESQKVARTKALRDAAPSRVTDAEIKTQVDAEYDTLLKPYIDALAKPDIGLATNMKRQQDAAGYDAYQNAVKDRPQLKGALDLWRGTREQEPDFYKFLSTTPGWMNTSNLIAGAFSENIAAMAAPANSPIAKTSDQVFKDYSQKNIQDGNVWKSTIEAMAQVGNKNLSPEFRSQIFERAFGPDSSDFLKYFAKDQWTAEPGKPMTMQHQKGQQWIFNTLTSDDMIKEGAKLAKAKPELYRNYEKFVQSSINYLLNDPTLMSATAPEGDRGRGRLNPPVDIHITPHYNDTDHTWIFMSDKGVLHRPDLDAVANNLQRAAQVAAHDPNHALDPGLAIYSALSLQNAPEGSIVNKMLKAMELSRQTDK